MYDLGYILLIPAFIFALIAQFKVKSTFNKYSKTSNRQGLTGADVAKQLLNISGITDVRVETIRGSLTDHYDPRNKVLRLSESVYGSTSIAAIGVAAHETGHAVQHNVGYSPLSIRNSILPVVSLGSNMAMPLIIIGLLLSSGDGSLGMTLLNIGVIMFSLVVAFQLITLPVEFNASKRAIEMIERNNFLNDEEVYGAKKMLSAAALTYVAAAAVAIAQLLRFILLSNSRRGRN